MAKLRKDLARIRKPMPPFELKSSREDRLAWDATSNSDEPEQVTVSFYGGAFDYDQDQEIKDAARRPDPRGATDPMFEGKWLWSSSTVKYLIPLVLLSHATSRTNAEVQKTNSLMPEGMDDGEWVPLKLDRQEIVAHIVPEDLTDFAEAQYDGWVRDLLGINEEETIENLAAPLMIPGLSPESAGGSLSDSTKDNPILPWPTTPSLTSADSPGLSEESPSPIQESPLESSQPIGSA